MSVEEAFDNITDAIQRAARNMSKMKCCCCGDDWKHSIEMFFCDTHYKKYKDIIGNESI